MPTSSPSRSPSKSLDQSIYVDITFTEGESLWGQRATFCGSGEWEYADTYIEIPFDRGTIQSFSVYLMYENTDKGYALFDDVGIAVFEPFDLEVNDSNKDSELSRTGHHNDCFLAGETDKGTYTEGRIEDEKDYLESETKYTTMGGETCELSRPRSNCTTALAELKRFHYTYLHRDYNREVLDTWEPDDGNCIDEIESLLGYRFILKTGTFGSASSLGGILPYSIEVENKGYAAPVNKHIVQLVMVEKSTGVTCGSIVKDDIRTWYGNETFDVIGNLELPDDIPVGTYDLFLNLADESNTLRTGINYKVRVC